MPLDYSYFDRVNWENLNRLQNAVHAAEKLFNATKRSRPSRAMIQKKAFEVSEALCLYERGIDTKKLSFVPLDSKQRINGDSSDIESLASRAKDILHKWRQGIRTNDSIYCPDYLDEYECDDSERKWVRLYDATVLSQASGNENSNVEITLGDSSKDEKDKHVLKKGESAIRVHYEGFGSGDEQWLLLTGKDSEHILPHKSTRKSVLVLEKSHRKKERIKKSMEKSEVSAKNLKTTSNNTLMSKRNTKQNKNGSLATSKMKRKLIETIDDDAPLRSLKRKKEENGSPNHSNGFKQKERNEIEQDFHNDGEKRKIQLPIKTKKEESQKEYPKMEQTNKKKGTIVKEVKSAQKKTQKASKEKKEEFTWICTACREAECAIEPDSPLLLCEGPCGRPFHYPCAGLHSLPPEDQVWMCTDCIQRKHQCAVCSRYGEDDVEVFKCAKKNCSLFFHEGCLSMYNVEVVVTEVNGETKPRFRCPAHECWTCAGGAPIMLNNRKRGGKKNLSRAGDGKSFEKKTGELFRCLDCPNAYHASCIPPNARFHELALLCHEHAQTSKLPYLDLKNSIQAEVEADVDKKIEKIRKSKSFKESMMNARMKDKWISGNPFLPVYVCPPVLSEKKNKAENDMAKINTYFRLPNDFREVVYAKPPSYTHVHTLKYDPESKPKRRPPNENGSCNCKPVQPNSNKIACDDNCLNKIIMIECVGDSASKKTNPYTNCNCGPNCGNRKLSRREVAKCRPKRENGKGWGLMAMENVKKGQLVQEYVGEVINEKKMNERLDTWSADNPHDTNFYIMQLEPGWFIDAREKGNLSRFINHSCDPNCKLVPINVAGFMRVAVMSIRDIEAGEFFSYDYQFDTNHADKFVCRCGADNCRGTMKGGSNQEVCKPAKKSLAQLKDEGRARLERDRKFLEQIAKDEVSRLNSIGFLVPGEPVNGSNSVASGPQEKDKDYVRNHRIFLWRNAQVGADFDSRHYRMMKKKKETREKW